MTEFLRGVNAVDLSHETLGLISGAFENVQAWWPIVQKGVLAIVNTCRWLKFLLWSELLFAATIKIWYVSPVCRKCTALQDGCSAIAKLGNVSGGFKCTVVPRHPCMMQVSSSVRSILLCSPLQYISGTGVRLRGYIDCTSNRDL